MFDIRAIRDNPDAFRDAFERKQKEVAAQAERIVASAKEEATTAATEAKADIAKSITRLSIASAISLLKSKVLK